MGREQRTEPAIQEISRPDHFSGFVQYLVQLQTYKFHLREEQAALLARKTTQNKIADFPITIIAWGKTESCRGTSYDISGHTASFRDRICLISQGTVARRCQRRNDAGRD